MDISGDFDRTLANVRSTTCTTTFTGTDDVDVDAFLFMHNIVLIRGKNEDIKAACVFAYLVGEALFLQVLVHSEMVIDLARSKLCSWS